MMDLVAGFQSITEIVVRWGDMDAYQHVNNTVYFRFFETARIAYFAEVNFGGVPSGVSPLLHTATCRFRFPVTHPDTVLVASRIIQLGQDRFKMYQKIISVKHQVVAAEGYSIIVAFDYDNGRTGVFPKPVYQTILERDKPEEKERIAIQVG